MSTVGDKKCTVSRSLGLFVLQDFIRELALVQDLKKPRLLKSSLWHSCLRCKQGPTNFRKNQKSHFQILGTGRVA